MPDKQLTYCEYHFELFLHMYYGVLNQQWVLYIFACRLEYCHLLILLQTLSFFLFSFSVEGRGGKGRGYYFQAMCLGHVRIDDD